MIRAGDLCIVRASPNAGVMVVVTDSITTFLLGVESVLYTYQVVGCRSMVGRFLGRRVSWRSSSEHKELTGQRALLTQDDLTFVCSLTKVL